METNLIYIIGETLIINIQSLENVFYPKENENPTELFFEYNKKYYRLSLDKQ